MTVRVTTLKGPRAGVYYVEQLPNYYLQSGEPRGVWFGDGAGQLGLGGVIDDAGFLAVMAGMDPARPERHLGRRYDDDNSVRGFDVTCSAPKSVSVLFALGDLVTRGEVVAAHDAAVRALAGWIEAHAHTRYRIGGEVATVDAEGIVAAGFRQHTSRALDPQLHTHLVIANRVMSPDRRWLALDGRLIKHDQRSLSAIYHAGLRAELTRRLGVCWREPEHGIAEIRDVPDHVLAEFSTRTLDVHRRIEDRLDRFHESTDRDPTPRERWRLEREAAIESRPTKTHSLDADVLHAQWTTQARSLRHEPARLVSDALDRAEAKLDLATVNDQAVMDGAMAAISQRQSTWRPTELHRELGAVIPTEVAAHAAEVVAWLDRTARVAVLTRCVDISRPVSPTALLRHDGRPVTESALDRALTTQAILQQEEALVAWADRRLRHDGGDEPAAPARSGVPLNVAQAEVAAAVAGRDDLVLVVGPAGTGKTTALAPAVEQLRADGRAVFGVAPSATAADVLAAETGVAADTLDKLLVEHRLARPPDHRYALPVGATVIVDEAGMMPTARLAELAALADTRGWRIALVGDPLQFSAVGRGGFFGVLADAFGAVELEKVHRFANDWERAASLSLRRGDVAVAEIYDASGRLHGGTSNQMERAAVDRWWEHRRAGRSVLLMAPTNEAVELLNQRAQHQRITAGEIDPTSRHVAAGSYRIHAGDEIATRHNDRHLHTDQGMMVKNRATWTVENVHADGALTVTGRDGTVTLPDRYVAEHVELDYARTGMGAQGRTVHDAVLYVDKTTDVRNVYVAMTRGTHSNEAYIIVAGEDRPRDVFERCMAADWIDQPAHARQAELASQTLHRPGVLDGEELRRLMSRRDEITTTIGVAELNLDNANREILLAEARREGAVGTIRELVEQQHAAAQVLEDYDRPLQRRRHTPEIIQARGRLDALVWQLSGTREAIAAAEARIAQQLQVRHAAQSTLERRPRLESELREIDAVLTDDLHVRTRVARLERPAVAVERLGERPLPGPRAVAWDQAAGRVLQYDSAFPKDHDGRREHALLRSLSGDLRRRVDHSVTECLDLDERGLHRGRGGPDLGR